MKNLRKLIYFLVIYSLSTLYTLSPIFAQTLETGNNGNGAGSNNSSTIAVEQNTSISQQNESKVENSINLNLTTGGNKTNNNVGDSQTTTGNIKTTVDVTNAADVNLAETSCGNCGIGDKTAKNTGNGANSENKAEIHAESNFVVTQSNETIIKNDTKVDANTGENKANNNVGDVAIATGNIEAEIAKLTEAGKNILNIFDCQNCQNGKINAENTKNGAYSQNETVIDISRNTNIQVSNQTKIENNLAVDAQTGGNECKNGVGNCHIETGDITIKVDVKNEAGKNETEVCGGKKPSPIPTPTITPTPTTTPPANGWPTATPTPTVTPTPTITPTPTPIGGVPSPTITPTAAPEAEKVPEAAKEKVPSVIEEALEKVKEILAKAIPEVEAAVPAKEEEAEVLGVVQLPVTGLGEMGPGISLTETLLGFILIGLGTRLRLLLDNKEEKTLRK